MNRKRKNEKRESETRALSGEVNQAMQLMVWIPPVSEGEVAAAEQRLRQAAPALPESLRDADAVLHRPADSGPPGAETIKFPENPEISAALDRAAREGGTIPPEIENRMTRDRQAAEEELKTKDP